MDLWTSVGLAVALALLFKVVQSWLWPPAAPSQPAKFQVGDLTLDGLQLYSGYDWMRPNLISIRGRLLDVTGVSDYNPGKPLHVYAGREIARALAKGSLAEEDLTDKLDDLTQEQMLELESRTAELMAKHDAVGQIVPPKALTLQQLAQHDGTQPGLPLYLAIQGTIYNITSGKMFYGPDGMYPFAGKEVARAFALLSTELSDCNDDLSELSSIELDNLKDWIAKFNSKYPIIGRIVKGSASDFAAATASEAQHSL